MNKLRLSAISGIISIVIAYLIYGLFFVIALANFDPGIQDSARNHFLTSILTLFVVVFLIFFFLFLSGFRTLGEKYNNSKLKAVFLIFEIVLVLTLIIGVIYLFYEDSFTTYFNGSPVPIFVLIGAFITVKNLFAFGLLDLQNRIAKTAAIAQFITLGLAVLVLVAFIISHSANSFPSVAFSILSLLTTVVQASMILEIVLFFKESAKPTLPHSISQTNKPK